MNFAGLYSEKAKQISNNNMTKSTGRVIPNSRPQGLYKNIVPQDMNESNRK